LSHHLTEICATYTNTDQQVHCCMKYSLLLLLAR